MIHIVFLITLVKDHVEYLYLVSSNVGLTFNIEHRKELNIIIDENF